MSFTIGDNNKLQSLQNQVNRLLVDTDPLTSTEDLLRLTDSLSVHQLISYQTAVMTHKIVKSGKPGYIADKIKPRQLNRRLRGGAGLLNIPKYRLSLSREGFIYRGATLFNQLDENIREEKNTNHFKKITKAWIKENILVEPKQFCPSIIQRPKKDEAYSYLDTPNNQLSNGPAVLHNQITRYFKPI